jgi:hypothetical protein
MKLPAIVIRKLVLAIDNNVNIYYYLYTNPFAKSGIEDKNRLRVNSTERGHRVKQLSN